MSKTVRRPTLLTVDAGPDHGVAARFYRLTIAGRGSGPAREDVLVPDGEALRIAHSHVILDEAA